VKTISLDHEQGSLEYLLLVHDELLDAVLSGSNVAEYRHGQREVRIEGRAVIGKLLFKVNARIGALMAKRVQGKDLVRGRRAPSAPGGHLADGVGMKILKGTL
jgi:hypothetical protein